MDITRLLFGSAEEAEPPAQAKSTRQADPTTHGEETADDLVDSTVFAIERSNLAEEALKTLEEMEEEGNYNADYDSLLFVNGCMTRHRQENATSSRIQEIGCRISASLLKANPQLIQFVGDRVLLDSNSSGSSSLSYNTNSSVALHRTAMCALMLYDEETVVVRESVNLISTIASMTTDLHGSFIRMGTHWAVLSALDTGRALPIPALQTIHSLAIKECEYGKAVFDCGALGVLTEHLDCYSGKRVVEALKTLATLIRFAPYGHGRLLNALSRCLAKVAALLVRHSDDDIVVELVQEVFCSLAESRERLNAVQKQPGGFRVVPVLVSVCEVMIKSPSNEGVHLKGCFLASAFHSLVSSTEDASFISKAVSRSLHRHASNLTLLAQCCSTILKYALKFQSSARAFLEEKVHVKLFELLDIQMVHQSLPEVLAQLILDCVFALACVRNLKNAMLCSVAAHGLLGGVKCLTELGADRNFVHSTTQASPLASAAEAGRRNVVQFLLYQGVHESRVSSALAAAIKSDQKSIVLTLIRHLCVTGNCLSLRNMNLHEIQADWFGTENSAGEAEVHTKTVDPLDIKVHGLIRSLSGIKIHYDFPSSEEENENDEEHGEEVDGFDDDFVSSSTNFKRLRLGRAMLALETPLLRVSAPSRVEREIFDFSANRIASIDSFLASGATVLRHVFELNLSDNKLQSIPQNLSQALPVLRVLNLKANLFDRFPGQLLFCKNLLSINLSENHITLFNCYPDVCPVDWSLRKLDLSRNRLRHLQGSLQAVFPHLEYLSVSRNRIVSLGEEPLGLKHLATLDLSYNELTSISFRFLGGCHGLESLDVSHNSIHDLCCNCPYQYPSLRHVNAACNQLGSRQEFPDFVLKLPNLEVVDLSYNSSLEVFPAPRQWTSNAIKEIHLSRCHFTNFDLESDVVQFWGHLKCIDLEGNGLKEVPKSLSLLSNLTSLNLSENREIRRLPLELGNLKDLDLKITGLPNLCLPGGARFDLAPSPAIVRLLDDTLVDGENWNRVRLFVVGQNGSGKTTLVSKLTGQMPPESGGQDLKIIEWQAFSFAGISSRSERIAVSCWEFESASRSRLLQQCFYTSRAIYLVLFRLTDGLLGVDQLKQQLKEIYARVPSALCLVVGTDLDHASLKAESFMEETRSALAGLLLQSSVGIPRIVSSVEINCHASSDVDQVREMLVSSFLGGLDEKERPLAGEQVPKYYRELLEVVSAERLARLKSIPVINLRHLFRLFVSTRRDLSRTQLTQAVAFLHATGEMFRYETGGKDDATGGAVCFLDVPWLVGMLSNVTKLRLWSSEKTGLVRRRELHTILKPALGSSSFTLSPIVINILRDFQLVIPYGKDRFLLPSLVPILWTGTLLSSKSEASLERQLVLPYVPTDFWQKLVSHLVVFGHELTAILRSSSSAFSTLSEPDIKFWSDGICFIWTETMFFLVRSPSGSSADCVSIRTAINDFGAMMLASVANHIEAIIAERVDLKWSSVEVLVPCPNCKEGRDTNVFEYESLAMVLLKKQENFVNCPFHDDPVSLNYLIPELVLSESEASEKDSHSLLPESAEHVAVGSYACSLYKNKPVLSNSYGEMSRIDLKTYRQFVRQVQFGIGLRRHSSILSLIAYSFQSQLWLAYEAAPLGTLSATLESRQLERIILYRFAYQITLGLAFMHGRLIAHNNLTCRAVFVFSLSPDDEINVKIGDFVRATWISSSAVFMDGDRSTRLMQHGRRQKNDVLALGVVLADLSRRHVGSWPEFDAVAERCLETRPARRPTARAVVTFLARHEVVCIERAVPVSLVGPETVAVQCDGQRVREIWLTSSNLDFSQVSVLDLNSPRSEAKGTVLFGERILCLFSFQNKLVLAGTLAGSIWALDHVPTLLRTRKLACVNDSILCLHHAESNRADFILAGIADGRVAVFDTDELLQHRCTTARRFLHLGHRPVTRICRADDRLWFSHGAEVVVWSCGLSGEERRWTTTTADRPPVRRRELVTHLCTSGDGFLWTSTRRSSRLRRWDRRVLGGGALTGVVDCETALRRHAVARRRVPGGRQLDSSMCWVTAMIVVGETALWVGTGGGYLIAFCPNRLATLVVMKKGVKPIRCLARMENDVLLTNFDIAVAGLTDGSSVANEETAVKKRMGQVLLLSPNSHQLVETVRKHQTDSED
ncbi:leucine-rich repeat serine/threonine-protein kinase 2-like [Oscarella lobularis]|uniref:leucine-rich repeat serine/threonine-protein kinase 2-like n=1 Tax=Oscarella lobularis TaxID=121494 RepID=UPI0033131E3D